MINKLSGKKISPVGVGTWHMGGVFTADTKNDKQEIASIEYALDNGINVIDTAELYGRGHAEEIVAEAIKGRERDKIHITTKILPTKLSRKRVIAAAEASLKRLNSKYIDLYLIHWPTPILDIKEIISAMEELVDKGTVMSIGVSNFNIKELEGAMAAVKKYEIEANQVHYSLLNKEIERDLIPFCEENKITIQAYTPLEKGRVVDNEKVMEIAKKYKKTPAQVAINYLTERALPIPKAANISHMKEIVGSFGWKLSKSDYSILSGI